MEIEYLYLVPGKKKKRVFCRCRDEGDLLDSEDAIYVRPKYRLKKRPEDEDGGGPGGGAGGGGKDKVLDIDVRLAMRCTGLLEEGQALEAAADFKGAEAKYQEMRSLGAHFRDHEMGHQV